MTMRSLLRARRLAPVAFIGTLVLFLASGSAGAAGGPIQVRAIDATGTSTTIDVVNSGSATPSSLRVSIDGDAVANPTAQSFTDAQVGTDVMVVLDNARSSGNGAVQIAKEELTRLAPGHDGITTLGVVTIGNGATLTVPSSVSMDTVSGSASDIAPGGNPALWDGIVKAANTLGSDTSTSHQIVLITAAGDAGSAHSLTDAQTALLASHSVLHVFALSGGSPDVGDLTGLVQQAGGSVQSGNSDLLGTQLDKIATQISHQYRITVPSHSGGRDDLASLHISWGGNQASASYRLDQYLSGTSALAPISNTDTLWVRLSSSTLVKWLIVLLGMASVGMLFYSLAMLASRSGDGLDFALRHYDGTTEEDNEAATQADDIANKGIAASAAVSKVQFLRKAVAVTGDLAQRQGALQKIEDLLERADLPLRPAEALFFYAATVVVVALAALVLSGNPLILLMMVLIALLVPNFVVKFRAKSRRKKFVAQLPDMLQLLSGTLRAGYSIAQGMEAVSTEVDGPMGRELRRVMVESRLGRPLEEALDAAAERTQSEDFGWAVMAIRIQREVGGNLAELLMTVAETMVQRERLRRDVASLTAEGRMSAYILGCLPPGIAAVICVTNKEYILRLTQDTIGWTLIIAAVVSMLVGFLWMNKIIKIEI